MVCVHTLELKIIGKVLHNQRFIWVSACPINSRLHTVPADFLAVEKVADLALLPVDKAVGDFPLK